jgi:chromosome segregation ATPase
MTTWSNRSMSDDIEQRLAAAAQAARELEVTRRRCDDLQARQDQLDSELEALQSQYQLEQKDVGRLEHLSLSRVLVTLRGSHDEALAREQAEANAVRLRLADAQARLDAVRAEHQAALSQADRLASAPAAYTALLAEKERHLTESDDPRRATLLNLADERGRLTAELGEMQAAMQAAGAARQALSAVEDRLGSASSWNTYDTFFRGGMIATAMEHSRLDDAAQAAAEADRRMAVLRTDLTELDQVAETSPMITLSSATRFMDLWFNNIFTDLAVRDRIKQGQQNVAQSLQMVSAVEERLKAQLAQVQSRLTEIEAQRRNLLTAN